MDIATIGLLCIMLAVDIFLLMRDMKHKVTYKGNSQFQYVMPTMILVFIILQFRAGNFKILDIILIIVMIPLCFAGKKCGINEEGILMNSFIVPWTKVEEFKLEQVGKRYLFQFRSNIGIRKIYFNSTVGAEVDEYLNKNRKIRHRRK